MSKCPIGIGNCSFTYLYILGSSIIALLEDYVISLNDIKEDCKYNIFKISLQIKKHKIIRLLYKFIGYIIFGSLFLYIFNRINNRKKTITIKKSQLNNSLIYNDNYIFFKSTIKEIIIVYILYSFQLLLRRIINLFKTSVFDLWIFNIIFIIIFMKYYFDNKIYSHKKYSLIFIFITNLALLLGLTFIKSYHSKNNPDEKINAYDYIKEVFGNIFFCTLIYFIYLCLSCFLSLSRVYAKILMEKKYKSPYEIIFIIGIFGFVFTLITLIFTSIFKCNSKFEDYCTISDYNNNNYLDSIPLYLTNIKSQYKNLKKDFFIEVLITIPLFLFVSFIQFVFEMVIIFHLNPTYILISDCLYFSIKRILNFMLKKDKHYFRFYLNLIADILALFGYFIYLEIIDIKCCNLNKNYKNKIIERGILDYQNDEDNESIGPIASNDKNNNNNINNEEREEFNSEKDSEDDINREDNENGNDKDIDDSIW